MNVHEDTDGMLPFPLLTATMVATRQPVPFFLYADVRPILMTHDKHYPKAVPRARMLQTRG